MKKIISIVSLLVFPGLALAVGNANELFSKVNDILKLVLPVIISISVIYFVYNAFSYMIVTDEEKKGEVKSKMIYGVIALFVMVSIWGLVNILGGTFELDKIAPPLPQIGGFN